MSERKILKHAMLTTTLAAVLGVGTIASVPSVAIAQPTAARPASEFPLSVGNGRMVRLDGQMSDLFVANDAVADVQVRSADQIYIFGKAAGETTIYATNKAGRVLFSANVRVGNNLASIDEMLRIAMPDAQVRATPLNGTVLLTGTVAAPADVEEASRIVQAYVGDSTKIISRLKSATPLQVMLQVKIAEVSRSLSKRLGVNLLTRDQTGGFLFGIGQGNPGTITNQPVGTLTNPITGEAINRTVYNFANKSPGTTLGFAGKLLGIDLLSTLDLAEQTGLATTLAEPSLTALSGETASFLAGGEFPVPSSQGVGGTSIEFKPYGVSLAFTPTVLEGGRISMRVRPEVSEISSTNAVVLNGFEVPSLSTRRTETTVELGSGQSFMIGGLLQNSQNNSIDKAPWLGDIPIIGSLFRSTNFRRNETELVIIVTPYLVKPVSANQISLPTDGYRNPDDFQRFLLGQQQKGRSGEQRPQPVAVPPRTVGPATGAGNPAVAPVAAIPVPQVRQQATPARQSSSAAPGFSF